MRFFKKKEWIKPDNNRIIEAFSVQDGTCSLLIKEATPQDAGKYTLLVKTPTQKAQKSTNINIKYVLSFIVNYICVNVYILVELEMNV